MPKRLQLLFRGIQQTGEMDRQCKEARSPNGADLMREQDRLGDSWLESSLTESSFAEKEMVFLANKKLNKSQHCVYNKG